LVIAPLPERGGTFVIFSRLQVVSGGVEMVCGGLGQTCSMAVRSPPVGLDAGPGASDATDDIPRRKALAPDIADQA
jgi:hypothetical protein